MRSPSSDSDTKWPSFIGCRIPSTAASCLLLESVLGAPCLLPSYLRWRCNFPDGWRCLGGAEKWRGRDRLRPKRGERRRHSCHERGGCDICCLRKTCSPGSEDGTSERSPDKCDLSIKVSQMTILLYSKLYLGPMVIFINHNIHNSVIFLYIISRLFLLLHPLRPGLGVPLERLP